MDLATYQRNLFGLLFDPEPGLSVAALTNPRGKAERWQRYRKMVRDRLEEVAENSFPRLRRVLGATFPDLVRRWLEEAPPSSPFLRDVHGEFARFAIAVLPTSAAPAWAGELARYEWALLDTSYVAEEQGAAAVDGDEAAFTMDRGVVLAPAHRLLRSTWSVHHVAADGDSDAVVAGDFSLCLYRDPRSFEVRVLELDVFAAALLGAIAADPRRPLVESLREAAHVAGKSVDGDLVATFAELASDLIERGVWLGVIRP